MGGGEGADLAGAWGSREGLATDGRTGCPLTLDAVGEIGDGRAVQGFRVGSRRQGRLNGVKKRDKSRAGGPSG